MTHPAPWRRGLPRGRYYPGMIDDYEMAFAPLAKWHRRRTPLGSWLHATMRAVLDCPSLKDDTLRNRVKLTCNIS